jgi:hypothetical protein
VALRKDNLTAGIGISFALILLFASSSYAQQGRQLTLENSTPSPNRRLALVIGNGAYANASPLKNPPNDATDMADALSNVGFTVEYGVDLTQRRMKSMIREFGQKLRGGGQGLFYFAGHGVQLRGHNYLIPIDADIKSEADLEDQGVDANLMLGLMDEAGNGLNVVILDACRNNPFARSFRSISNGLAQMDAPSGTLIAYATAPGSVASDGNARNGLYTQELLKNIPTPGLSIEEMFKRVRISVRNATAGKQTPWESSSLIGDFYFSGSAPDKNQATIIPPRVQPQPTPKAATLRKESNFFTFELDKCRSSGTSAVCDFTVTNNDKDRVLQISTSYLFDDFGNQFQSARSRLGSSEGSNPRAFMVAGVPTKGRVTFERISGDATKITLLKLRCLLPINQGPVLDLRGDRFEIEYRNISLRE